MTEGIEDNLPPSASFSDALRHQIVLNNCSLSRKCEANQSQFMYLLIYAVQQHSTRESSWRIIPEMRYSDHLSDVAPALGTLQSSFPMEIMAFWNI